MCGGGNPPRGTHKLQGKPLFLQCLSSTLSTRLSIMPTGTGKLFKGLKSIFVEQAVKGEFGVEGVNEQLTHLVKQVTLYFISIDAYLHLIFESGTLVRISLRTSFFSVFQKGCHEARETFLYRKEGPWEWPHLCFHSFLCHEHLVWVLQFLMYLDTLILGIVVKFLTLSHIITSELTQIFVCIIFAIWNQYSEFVH